MTYPYEFIKDTPSELYTLLDEIQSDPKQRSQLKLTEKHLTEIESIFSVKIAACNNNNSGSILGKGGYGTVVAVQDKKNSSKKYAIKIIHASIRQIEYRTQIWPLRVRKEFGFAKLFSRHPYMAKIYGAHMFSIDGGVPR